MSIDTIVWDLQHDPAGNVWHCAEHGISQDEVEGAIRNATDADVSRTSGLPVFFGDTAAGRHLIVICEVIDATTVYPVTAYEVPRRRRR